MADSDCSHELDRRRFLSRVPTITMAGGLLAGYGYCLAIAGRYLYPSRPPRRGWMFVTRIEEIEAGGSVAYTAPDGSTITIARQGSAGTVEDFVALSSVCPHLGCKVHWEAHNDRFFCPCNNGVFTPRGVGIEGPPGDAGQSLSMYPLRLQGDLLFIEVPIEEIS